MKDIELKFIGFKNKSKHAIKISNYLDKISLLYNDGYSILNISQTLEIDESALTKLFKANSVKIRTQEFYSRKHKILDESYFDNIDSEEKAYILGLIYADGNNYKKQNRIAIKLLKSDQMLLEKISHIIYGKNFLQDVNVIKNGKTYKYVVFHIYSKCISDQMEKLGVVPRKSTVLTFPKWLDEKLYRHFIRGLIDGDGSIYLHQNKKIDSKISVSLIGTADVNDHIAKYLLDHFKISTYKRPVKNKSRDVFYTLAIEGKAKSKIFLEWIYGDSKIFLDRKFKKYLSLKNEIIRH